MLENFEVEENLKTSFYCGHCCSSCFVFIMLFFTIGFFLRPPPGVNPSLLPLVFLIIWPIIIAFYAWVAILLRGTRKTRTLTISNQLIKIHVPNKTPFQIQWSEFDNLEVKKRRTHGVILDTTTVYYTLIFEGQGEREFTIESGKDFKGRTVKKILKNLEEFSNKMNKRYFGP